MWSTVSQLLVASFFIGYSLLAVALAVWPIRRRFRTSVRKRKRLIDPLFSLLCLLGTPWVILGQTQPEISLPINTAIDVHLIHQLDTIRTQAEETFLATLSKAVVIDGRVVFARGTIVTGRVREVASSNRLQQPASITLELTDVGGMSIRTRPLQIGGKAHLFRDLRLIGRTARTGTPYSGIAWLDSGTGFGIGGGSRTATRYLTNGNEIVLPVETVLSFSSQ